MSALTVPTTVTVPTVPTVPTIRTAHVAAKADRRRYLSLPVAASRVLADAVKADTGLLALAVLAATRFETDMSDLQWFADVAKIGEADAKRMITRVSRVRGIVKDGASAESLRLAASGVIGIGAKGADHAEWTTPVAVVIGTALDGKPITRNVVPILAVCGADRLPGDKPLADVKPSNIPAMIGAARQAKAAKATAAKADAAKATANVKAKADAAHDAAKADAAKADAAKGAAKADAAKGAAKVSKADAAKADADAKIADLWNRITLAVSNGMVDRDNVIIGLQMILEQGK